MEIKKGYKQTELGIIPEEWEVKKIGDCFEFLTTNSYSREKMTYEEQEYMNIHYGDIHMKYGATLDIEEMKGKIPYIKSEETLPKKIILIEEGDLLIADASEDYKDIGKSTEVLNVKDSKILGGLHTLLLRDKNNYFINGYKGYILRSEKISKEVKKIATGISVLGISKTNLSELNIPIPPLKEQEKIAEVLSCYDKAIEQQELLMEKEKEFKKGMMQKIFSQEIRFKGDDGENYPEWEEKRLLEIGEIITGKTPSTKEEKYWNGNIQFVTPTDIRNKKYQIKTDRFVTEEIQMKFLPIGTIMFTCIGATIGKMSIATKICITNQQINSIIVKENIDSEYIYYFLLYIVPRIQSSKSTTTMPIINKTEFSNIYIKLPVKLEQEKIANFLSDVDRKIELLENKLQLLKNEKKGMLQKLLTGEIRV